MSEVIRTRWEGFNLPEEKLESTTRIYAEKIRQSWSDLIAKASDRPFTYEDYMILLRTNGPYATNVTDYCLRVLNGTSSDLQQAGLAVLQQHFGYTVKSVIEKITKGDPDIDIDKTALFEEGLLKSLEFARHLALNSDFVQGESLASKFNRYITHILERSLRSVFFTDTVEVDQLEDDTADVWTALEKRLMREDFADAVSYLDPKAREVIVTRYGLEDGIYKTIEEVAAELGVNKDSIRYTEANALRRLRNPYSIKFLRPYIESSRSLIIEAKMKLNSAINQLHWGDADQAGYSIHEALDIIIGNKSNDVQQDLWEYAVSETETPLAYVETVKRLRDTLYLQRSLDRARVLKSS